MKKLLLLGACLLALGSSPVAAQAGGPGVAVVSIVNLGPSYKAVITREDSKSEALEIPNGGSDKRLMATSQGFQKLISKLYQEGYTLKSTFGGDRVTNLVFVKGQ